jgi:hypothetical protein
VFSESVREPEYRPKKSAHDAVGRVRQGILQRKTRVIDLDLRSYFDNVRHQVPDGDLGKILARAVGVLLEQVRKQKFGECEAPRPSGTPDGHPSRKIPAVVRRAVARRDGGRCTYVSANGKRCGSREFLEFHHRDPWARNPEHTIAGISLRCRAHDQHEARRDFGERHMDRFRKREEERVDTDPESLRCRNPADRPQRDLDPVARDQSVPRGG